MPAYNEISPHITGMPYNAICIKIFDIGRH